MSTSIALLMYHSIARTTTPGFARLTVDPAAFDEHLAALREAGFRLVTLTEAVTHLCTDPAPRSDGPLVAVTIDDALADVAMGAIPALTRHRARATVFVPTAFVGGRAGWLRGEDAGRRLLDWSDLATLADAGIEIGSHGHRHIACDVNPPALVEDDARHSRELLEQRLGRPVPSFAFPFGYGPGPARDAIRRAGFRQAVVVSDLVAQGGDDRYGLPRLHVGPGMTAQRLVSLARGRSGPVARRWSHTKQRIWTAGRRHAGWGPPEASALARREVPAR
jgi:peptidoglycan/xylan/chitin deacetylase (PgdA/CDA1 family)